MGSSKKSRLDDTLNNIPADPGLRTRILDYDPNIRDEIRRAYIQKGPCQPRDHAFPQTNGRRFISNWFDDYDWLEYSISSDALFCLYCYLFKTKFKGQGDAFTSKGWKNWKYKRHLQDHVGLINSPHNQA